MFIHNTPHLPEVLRITTSLPSIFIIHLHHTSSLHSPKHPSLPVTLATMAPKHPNSYINRQGGRGSSPPRDPNREATRMAAGADADPDRFESFLLAEGEKKVEVTQDTRKHRSKRRRPQRQFTHMHKARPTRPSSASTKRIIPSATSSTATCTRWIRFCSRATKCRTRTSLS